MSARPDGRDAKRGVISVATCAERSCQADGIWRLFVGNHPTKVFACTDHRTVVDIEKAAPPGVRWVRWILVNAAGVPK
jgi:hypothetical protein